MSVTEEKKGYVGARVKRREDAPLLTGRGTYVENMTPVGTAFMAVVRSPFAHARVKGVDLAGGGVLGDRHWTPPAEAADCTAFTMLW